MLIQNQNKAGKKIYSVGEITAVQLLCSQELMGIACNATWQESDPDACLRVRTRAAQPSSN